MGESVVVRRAGPADAAAVAELWYVSHLARRNGRELPKEVHDRVHERIASPTALPLIAEEAGPVAPPGGEGPGPAVVGCILGTDGREDGGAGPRIPGLLHISLVSVHPDRWGEHVGRLLVEAMLGEAVARGYVRAQLWTHADNSRANRLYRAMGFRRTGLAQIDDWGELIVHYRREIRLV